MVKLHNKAGKIMTKFQLILQIVLPVIAVIFAFGILYGDVADNTKFRGAATTIQTDIAVLQNDMKYIKETLCKMEVDIRASRLILINLSKKNSVEENGPFK